MEAGSRFQDEVRRISLMGGLGVAPMVKLSLPGRRLLAYLALRGLPVGRRIAAAHLWPDVPEHVGRTNLRRTLWQLPKGWVATLGDELVLQAECDLPGAYQAATSALEGDTLAIDQVLLLCEDILPGWVEEWLSQTQDAFRTLRVQALEQACRTMAARGHHALAVQAGSAAVAADPLSESAAEALIDAHLAQHNRYQALQCYRCLAQRLSAELGIAPDPALQGRVAELGIVQSARVS